MKQYKPLELCIYTIDQTDIVTASTSINDVCKDDVFND